MENSNGVILSKRQKSQRREDAIFQTVITVIAVLLLALSFITIYSMIVISLKGQAQIYRDFFGIPNPIFFVNYKVGIAKLLPNMTNSLLVVAIATALVLLLSTVSGYVFARLQFAGKEFFYLLLLALMMIPGCLTLTSSFSLTKSYGIINTWWALILPWVSGGQVWGIMLCRNYMEGLPNELFESARLDGCTELGALFRIAMPLSKPILATVVVMKMIDYYNDFIWPLMVIQSNDKQVITVAIRTFQSALTGTDTGAMVAGFVFATIPLLILFLFTSRLYMEGLTAGAVKG